MSEETKKKQRHLDVDVLPIVVITKTNPAKTISHAGTGFLIAPNLLITCWHCVRNILPEDQAYAVSREGGLEFSPLKNLEQDKNKTDLATANVALIPEAELTLAERDVFEGTDVYSFGYPLLSFDDIPETNEKWLFLDFRYLKGYITRNFWRIDPVFGKGVAYELDMPAPEGLSGAPLFRSNSREVLGVIFGHNDVSLIEYLGQFDHETGKREPDIQKIYHFGLAHNTETLRNLTTNATRNLPLHEYLKEDFSKRKAYYQYYVRGRLLLENSDLDVLCECGFTNRIEFPYKKLYCTWCASYFGLKGVGDHIALVSKDEIMHKVIGADGGFVTIDDGNLGFIIEKEKAKELQIVKMIGEKEAENSQTELGPYIFPVKTGLIGKENEIILKCICGYENKWQFPHNESDLNCSSCLARFIIMELEGDGKFVMAGNQKIPVIGA